MSVLEHHRRRAEILREHPEVRALIGARPLTAVSAAGVLGLQLAMAAVLGGRPWWQALLAAVLVGAFASHFLHVVIHEASHNLVFRGTRANKAIAIFANLLSVFPSAIGFRHYHLLHHRFLNVSGSDADVAPDWEVRLFGRGRLGKLMWIVLQPVTYGLLHPVQTEPKRRIPLDGWLIGNVVLVVAAAFAVGFAFGGSAVIYLAVSTYLAVGPHVTGAHILQEHLIFEGRYETASYYGPINAISLNHGMHVEHHDLPGVPGPSLKQLRRLAPAYYEGRFTHRSRLATLWRFVTDPAVGLDSRLVDPR